jgi:hypothetical protein
MLLAPARSTARRHPRRASGDNLRARVAMSRRKRSRTLRGRVPSVFFSTLFVCQKRHLSTGHTYMQMQSFSAPTYDTHHHMLCLARSVRAPIGSHHVAHLVTHHVAHPVRVTNLTPGNANPTATRPRPRPRPQVRVHRRGSRPRQTRRRRRHHLHGPPPPGQDRQDGAGGRRGGAHASRAGHHGWGPCCTRC